MPRQGIARVIIASSVGTVIEFYDFFIFAALASTIAAQFYSSDKPTLEVAGLYVKNHFESGGVRDAYLVGTTEGTEVTEGGTLG